MRTMAIRELTGPALRRAAEDNEVVGITNDRVLAGILFPIGRDWVEQLVDQNLSRIVRNVQRGEQEMEAVLAASDGADAPAENSTTPQFTTLEDVARDLATPPPGALGRSRRVHLRDMSGKLLRDAAEQGQAIILTTNKVAAGVILPVTQRWVTELVEQNLSRVLYNVSIGEKELAADPHKVTLEDVVTLDDVVDDEPAARGGR